MSDVAWGMETFLGMLQATWGTPGVSEFLSALLGGSITLLAQRWALLHDREKDEIRRKDDQKGLAWSIYFKIGEVHEALTHVARDLAEARAIALKEGAELWQIFQCAPHDAAIVRWETQELVFLLDHEQFELMERYRLATAWLSNLVQSMRTYREMRIEFLSGTPSDVHGTRGSIIVDDSNRQELLPLIAHLRSLSESLEKVVIAQQPDARALLQEYAAAMKQMIGKKPNLEFFD